MEKTTFMLTVAKLAGRFLSISFPEYQREPNVWDLLAKQRPVDSMLRQFDIASIYLYLDEDGSIDCIDGRQRIGAIMSFLGQNHADSDNGFAFRILNEVYEDEDHPLESVDGMTFQEASDATGTEAQMLVSKFSEYEVNVVQLSGSQKPAEFNLQFTRLNLGTILNSGEKLHAMVGDLRNVCFGDRGLGEHAFLEMTNIPTRRFAREQVATQIVANVFSQKRLGEYARTRHFDMQRLFKEYAELAAEPLAWIEEVRATLDVLEGAFGGMRILRNRAITVSTVLLAWKLDIKTDEEASKLAAFMEEFLCRLKWQVGLGIEANLFYRYLIDFQRHVTQASVERPAVAARAETLELEYERWKEHTVLQGDEEYTETTHGNPSADCREFLGT